MRFDHRSMSYLASLKRYLDLISFQLELKYYSFHYHLEDWCQSLSLCLSQLIIVNWSSLPCLFKRQNWQLEWVDRCRRESWSCLNLEKLSCFEYLMAFMESESDLLVMLTISTTMRLKCFSLISLYGFLMVYLVYLVTKMSLFVRLRNYQYCSLFQYSENFFVFHLFLSLIG